MSFIRNLENRFFGTVRDPQSATATAAAPQRWSVEALRGHKYCLLTSFRKNGAAVNTPVWFGIAGEKIYVRSGAEDGKVKRIRRRGDVLVSPCTARGRPLGPPMTGSARVLERDRWAGAEDALRNAYGLGRRVYRVLRRRIEVAYIEVGAGLPG